VDEEIDEEANRKVYWTLCSQENSVRKYSRVGVSSVVKSTPGGECEKNSEVLRIGRGIEEDSISSSRDRGGERV